MELSNQNQLFVANIKTILELARQKAYSAINTAMVEAYWHVGKHIVEQEQSGQQRAEYGTQLLKLLSTELTTSFGKGFSERNLRNFRQFYVVFPNVEIWQTASAELSWSHYQLIMRVSNLDARNYYLREAAENTWTVRTLDRNIASQYYERLLLSQIKEPVMNEMLEKTTNFQADKFEFIKNPTVLEFLNLPANKGFTEKELEQAIINHLQQFLLELGKGYAFVAQQQLMRTENKDYFIDLVFYNFILKCFVLIDLKTDRITHQDVGQMDMYVRMYDERKINEGDNPTIGIVLCSETDQDIARYSILNGNEQIFATKYKLFLPTEDELRAEIEREKLIIKLQLKNNAK
jgi:predicted nuclease of restriction endonuclease-like (RecB) superfamily